MKLLLFTVFIYSVYADARISSHLEPLTDEIVKSINDLKTSWKAGKNFADSPSIDIYKLVSNENELYHDFSRITHDLSEDVFPDSFDSRKFWPECSTIGKIYDQRNGAPSWIYATVGQIADRLCIKYGIPIDVEKTIKRMTEAFGGLNSQYNSTLVDEAFNYWSKKGIITVKSLKNSDCLPLSSCKTQVKLDKYFKIDNVYPASILDKMRDIMVNGPFAIQMKIYSDFPSYKSGVYQRVSDKFLGIQVIKLIGWGFENNTRYWLTTNSWGTQWGDNGVAKIRWGTEEFGIGMLGLSASFQRIDHLPSSVGQDQMFELA